MGTEAKFSESLSELFISEILDVKKTAFIAGVSVTTVYLWKKGKDIKLSHLVKLANHLNCSIEYLIGRNAHYEKIKPSPLPHFGKRLRNVMSEYGITTYELRKKGYGSQHFDNWDNGADPTLQTLVSLANIFHCDIDYLIGKKI